MLVVGMLLVGHASASHLASRLNLKFDRINTREGLSQTTANAIMQDSFGMMWIATSEGLNRYDGKAFEQFYSLPSDPSSLSHDYVSEVIEDAQGNLWVATDGGLNLFNRVAATFQLVDFEMRDRGNDPGESSIRSLFLDKYLPVLSEYHLCHALV